MIVGVDSINELNFPLDHFFSFNVVLIKVDEIVETGRINLMVFCS